MKRYRVGIIGATGMVGQRFATLLERHPWFTVTALAASARAAGKTYEEAVGANWAMPTPIPESMKKLVVMDAEKDVDAFVREVDFTFCAVNMKKEEIKALEERYAKAECPVISNNSALRCAPDVPMIIPEINPEHVQVISAQRKRLGTKRGFVAVKSNCSHQSYHPTLHPQRNYGLTKVLACTYQAISGAGKTFATWPEMVDNVIPFIGGEEEKSEREPLKIWGSIIDGQVVPAKTPSITTQCIRVPVTDGHLAAVFASFEQRPVLEEVIEIWRAYEGRPQQLELPSAPKHFLRYFEEENRPQIALDRGLENGMTVSVGRLRQDTQYDLKFVCLSHNTLRGAAGGAVLMAELLCAEGYM